ncbi:hypothetical protein BPJM79_120016 [Bacillus pumilus]
MYNEHILLKLAATKKEGLGEAFFTDLVFTNMHPVDFISPFFSKR